MYLNFAGNLFLEKAELIRFKESLDENGFRRVLLNNSLSFGLIKNTTDSSFENGRVESITSGKINIKEILAIDSLGNFIYKEAQTNYSIPDDSLWYWLRIEHQYSSIELGTIQVDANGNVTGDGSCEFTKLLRGQPNFPSKIRFVGSLYNNLEYEVLEVIDDNNIVLNIMSGVLYPETSLRYKIVGTFTPGYAPLTSEKYPFQYDSCSFSLVQNTTRPSVVGEEGKVFYIARVKNIGGTVTIEDTRIDFFETRVEYNLRKLPLTSNPLVGVESIKWDMETSTRDKNLVYLGWSFRSTNWTAGFSLNRITLSGDMGGKFKVTTDFIDGDFDGWRLYFQSGSYVKIKQSIKDGTYINLTVDNLPSYELQDEVTGAKITQELVICPDAEEIEFEFTAPVSEGTELPSQKFRFNINERLGKCPILVYKDGGTYEIQYRYRTFNTYNEWTSIPTDSIQGYYSEDKFDSLGELVVSPPPTRTPYTTTIRVYLATQSYGNLNLGDLLGVEYYTLTASLKQIYVGTNRQYIVVQGSPSIGVPTYINLNKKLIDGTTNIRNGNSFILHIKGTPTLSGGTLKIVENYISSPESYTLLKEITQKEIRFLAKSDAGLFLRFTYDGTNWVYSSVNEIEPRGKIVMFSGTTTGNFDSNGLGIGEWLDWALCNGYGGLTPNLRGKFIVGYDDSGTDSDYDTIGKNNGTTKTHTLSAAELPKHTHPITGDGAHSHTLSLIVADAYNVGGGSGSASRVVDSSATTSTEPNHTHGGNTGQNADGLATAFDIRPPYYTLAFVMKL